MKDLLDDLIASKRAQVDNTKTYIDYLRQAYIFAEAHSTDQDTWTGALIVDLENNEVVSSGANRFAPGVEPTPERRQRPKKYFCQDHAERNAIFLAAKDGKKLEGTTMFMPWVPCSPCANGIITSGIKALVVHYDKCVKTPGDWKDDITEAIRMLLEAGVTIVVVTNQIGDCRGKFRGEEWSP